MAEGRTGRRAATRFLDLHGFARAGRARGWILDILYFELLFRFRHCNATRQRAEPSPERREVESACVRPRATEIPVSVVAISEYMLICK
jgi:hypothetical protein